MPLKFFDSVDSTQLEARRYVAAGREEGASLLDKGIVFLAREQVSGIGTQDRTWVSEEGGMYYTLLIRHTTANSTTIDSIKQAVCMTVLSQHLLAITPEAPNDFYVNGRKIGGMLVEYLRYNDTPVLLIGIGLNINQKQFPVDLYSHTTSMYLETSKVFSVKEIVKKLTEEIRLIIPQS